MPIITDQIVAKTIKQAFNDGHIITVVGATASGKSNFALHLKSLLQSDHAADLIPLPESNNNIIDNEKFIIDNSRFSNISIINADSMQIYREIPIITAQPNLPNYQNILHHLYGFQDYYSHDRFSVGQWLTLVKEECKKLRQNHIHPVIVGGSGLYISALLNNNLDNIPVVDSAILNDLTLQCSNLGIASLYADLMLIDPVWAQSVQPNDKQRIIRGLSVFHATGVKLSDWHARQPNKVRDKNAHSLPHEGDLNMNDSPHCARQDAIKHASDNNTEHAKSSYFNILLWQNRQDLYNNINQRVHQMLADSAVDEVAKLLNQKNHLISRGEMPLNYPRAIGVSELSEYIEGNISLNEAITQMQTKTRQYAKRQMTWFKNQLEYDLILTLDYKTDKWVKFQSDSNVLPSA